MNYEDLALIIPSLLLISLFIFACIHEQTVTYTWEIKVFDTYYYPKQDITIVMTYGSDFKYFIGNWTQQLKPEHRYLIVYKPTSKGTNIYRIIEVKEIE
mgnify:CR=1 FL=1